MGLVLSATGCAPTGRYVAQREPGSRLTARFAMERASGRWLQRQTEVRVPLARRLPKPLSDAEHGDMLHSSRFAPGSVGTGDLVPERFTIRDGYRLWRFMSVIDEDGFAGRTALGIAVTWPRKNQPDDSDPMELFPYAALRDQAPGEWTPWATAASMRSGAFGWWEEVHEHPEEPPTPIAHPFELRWRVVYARDPIVCDDATQPE